ncbi:type VI secretion system Vgr family protein [Chondromyces crocatus]|uniref:Gp5/Type VI secretion system Vgr protein OB-fold domain-containing protein n=1 Tax=Chondromyces crocatus TaxID=52 RepID=A0A0K1ENN5_CHOCO|nr:type VI secretion system tip protein TssI/VgrG [Chondromyces crocatus]AKT42449.1 uncharacterized protein CMC5_066750 [Chondromyces crocatus]
MKDLITISSSVLPESTRVAGFRGVEAISRPYQFELFLVLKNDQEELDLADAIGAKAKLELDSENDDLPPFIFSGVLASAELLHEYGGQALVRVVMVPRLWQLGLSRHSRLFTKKSIKDVLQIVLEENGLSGSDVELRLGGYDVEEHITQYRESDLEFISRWMEREGIFYFFEHGEDGEKLVLCDNRTYDHDEVGKPVRYFPQLGDDVSAGPSFRSFTSLHASLPSQVRLKDYDYARPSLAITGNAPVDPNGVGEVSLYGERFFSPAAGQRLARIRAEELLTRQVVYRSTGSRFHLRSGYTFDLEEHPRQSFNTRYLASEVRHYGNQATGLDHWKSLMGLEYGQVYFVEVSSIPADTQFRAASQTVWPRIYGYENAVVDGPADSEYAQIDAQGRYNIKFKFDESALKDGQASTFVRMMQPHGGSVEGFHFPLRKNTEVICSYLGGDPDRPVIVGVVPTAVTPSKVVAANHTQNIIQTGGGNYITLEDKSGSQFINIFAPIFNTNLYLGNPRSAGPHSLTLPSGPQVPPAGPRQRDALGPFAFDLRTDGSGQIHAGSNLNIDADAELQIESGAMTTIYSGADWHVDVQGAADEKYHATFKKEVIGAVDVDYQDTLNYDVKAAAVEHYHDTRNLTVTAAEEELFDDTLKTTVTQLATLVYNNGLDVTVNSALTDEKFNASKKQYVDGTYDTEVTGKTTLTTNGYTMTNKAATTEKTWGPSATFKFVVASDTVVGLKNDNFFGGKLVFNAGLFSTITLGFKFDFDGSVNFKVLGLQQKVEALQSKVSGFTLKAATTTMKTIAAGLEAHGTAMMMAGFRIM